MTKQKETTAPPVTHTIPEALSMTGLVDKIAAIDRRVLRAHADQQQAIGQIKADQRGVATLAEEVGYMRTDLADLRARDKAREEIRPIDRPQAGEIPVRESAFAATETKLRELVGYLAGGRNTLAKIHDEFRDALAEQAALRLRWQLHKRHLELLKFLRGETLAICWENLTREIDTLIGRYVDDKANVLTPRTPDELAKFAAAVEAGTINADKVLDEHAAKCLDADMMASAMERAKRDSLIAGVPETEIERAMMAEYPEETPAANKALVA